MSGTILVPLDGSSLAEEGLRAAAKVALDTGATLLLLTAAPFSAGGKAEREKERAWLSDAQHHLRYQYDMLRHRGCEVRTMILPGDPAAAILFAVAQEPIDLICMGTHGRAGLQQMLLGSVAAAVARDLPTPVLLTRGILWPYEPQPTPYRRIVVPLDGSPFAESALEFVATTGLGRNGELILVHAVDSVEARPIPVLTPHTEETLIYRRAVEHVERHGYDAERYMHTLAAGRLGGRDWRFVLSQDPPADAVLQTARTEQADLIVLATHNRHGMDRLVHGSVAHTVLRHAAAPVLLLEGKEAEPGR